MTDDLCALLAHLRVPHDPGRIRSYQPINVSAKVEICWDPHLRTKMALAEQSAIRDFGYSSDDTGEEEPRASGPAAWNGSFHTESLLQGPYTREGRNGWCVSLPAYRNFADDLDHPFRSHIVLREGEQALRPHALHEDIRNLGGGRYSHWRDSLLFSTSDNSDPNLNGRIYSLTCRPCYPGAVDSLLIPHPNPR